MSGNAQPSSSQNMYTKKEDSQADERKFNISNTKATANDVARLLNHDYEKINSIKPSIFEERDIDINTAHLKLRHIQREHDTLCITNIHLEKENQKILDNIQSLQAVDEAAIETDNEAVNEQHKILQKISDTEDLLEKEKKLSFMYEHMRIRTRDDIVNIRAITTNYLINIKKHTSELIALQTTLRSLNNDIRQLEIEQDSLQQLIDSRREQRNEQLHSLKSMANDSERSVNRFKSALEKNSWETLVRTLFLP